MADTHNLISDVWFELNRFLHAKALQATTNEGLAQGPYVAAGIGFEHATLCRKAPNLLLSHHAPPYTLKMASNNMLPSNQ